jgi:hypothetical protein
MSHPTDSDPTQHYDGPPTVDGLDGEEDFFPLDVVETGPPPPQASATAPAVSVPPPLPPSLRVRSRQSSAGTVLSPISEEDRLREAAVLIQECNAELDTPRDHALPQSARALARSRPEHSRCTPSAVALEAAQARAAVVRR